MYGIDTLSLGKLFKLTDTRFKTLIEELLTKLDLFITIEVKKEVKYRYSKFENYLELLTLRPVINKSLESYLNKGFDLADATLLEYSEIENFVIITEDNGMLVEGVTDKNNIIQLIDFLLRLYEFNLITKREIYHLAKYFRQKKNISKRKEKKLMNIITKPK